MARSVAKTQGLGMNRSRWNFVARPSLYRQRLRCRPITECQLFLKLSAHAFALIAEERVKTEYWQPPAGRPHKPVLLVWVKRVPHPKALLLGRE
jgi:hypothetical protein